MTLLFAEHGSTVGCFDKSPDAVKAILKTASNTDSVPNERVHGYSSLKKLVGAFPKDEGNDGSGERKHRIFVLSLPHGDVPDSIADELLPLLDKGDIIIDGGNEWWEATERRQRKAKEYGVEWVGMGVSGGCECMRHAIFTVHLKG
jgi:6-phosphogluconate dehydrogenase